MPYLDHHTVLKPSPLVVAQMGAYFQNKWGSLSMPHRMGTELYADVDRGLKTIEDRLGKGPHFSLTHGGGEAAFQLLLGCYLAEIKETGRNHILTTEIEEAPILLSLNRMEEIGCGVKMVDVDNVGNMRLESLEEALKPKAALVSISWANGLTGVVQPIQEIVKICRAKGVKIHLNGSHVVGKIDFKFEDLGVDYLSFDGDKLGTPQGIGGVIARTPLKGQNTHVAPLAGLATAIENMPSYLETARLRDQFEIELEAALPGCVALFKEAERVPHITTIAFPGIVAELLLYYLNERGVYASIGGGQTQKLAVILQKCGVDDALSHSALSFGLSHETTEDDLIKALDVIVGCVRQLKSWSRYL